jgi:hypothetical protein
VGDLRQCYARCHDRKMEKAADAMLAFGFVSSMAGNRDFSRQRLTMHNPQNGKEELECQPGENLLLSDQAVHLLRTVTSTNLTLSQMADHKANMLMGATFLVFTLSVGQASRGHLPLALLVLAVFALISALMAILAVLPATGSGAFSDEDSNLLFFGAFAPLGEEVFRQKIRHTIATNERIFAAMTRDIYQNGAVLKSKKYKFLRLGYINFLVGLCITFLVFASEQAGLLTL